MDVLPGTRIHTDVTHGQQTLTRTTGGPPLTVAQCVTLACLLEVTAPKPGNVHRGADFEDLTFADFMVSAVAVAPPLAKAAETGVGVAVLQAVQATRGLVRTNSNLGTVLLLAPLCAVPREVRLAEGVKSVLCHLTPEDASNVYEGIRTAAPGGLGTAPRMDVAECPPAGLLAAMQEAGERDLVARQYGNGFEQVFELVAPWLIESRRNGWTLLEGIVHTSIRLLADFPDSLIERKCGKGVAQLASAKARSVIAAGLPGEEAYRSALADLDFWMRSDHHRRNPGTTADLIAAGLFVVLREGWLDPPYR
jgi:triphosphoribosyl-dephospho-CoA synthase